MRVLFVDDDEALYAAAEKAFRHVGFDVWTETNSHRAMNRLDGDAGPVHALITDIRISAGQPHGFALPRMACLRHPELMVVYLTGYPELVGHQAEFVDGGTAFEKPIDLDVLAAHVSKALESKRKGAT
jgi:DNA-binding NtrC family response regulator